MTFYSEHNELGHVGTNALSICATWCHVCHAESNGKGAKISGTPHHEARRSHDPKLILKSERNIKKHHENHQETFLWRWLWQKMITCQDLCESIWWYAWGMNNAEPGWSTASCSWFRLQLSSLISHSCVFVSIDISLHLRGSVWIKVVQVETFIYTFILSSSHTATHVQEAVVPCHHRENATRSDPWLRIGLTLVCAIR